MSIRHAALAAATVASLGLGGMAQAAPPNILGNWNGVANQTTFRLAITFQGGAGTCRPVTGTFQTVPGFAVNSTAQGFYCPATGRFSILRKLLANNDTFQVFTGNVGDDAPTDRMSGTFAAHNGGGVLGEYNFSFTRP